MVVSKINKSVENITCLTVWGNHSATQYPDLSHTLINGERIIINKA